MRKLLKYVAFALSFTLLLSASACNDPKEDYNKGNDVMTIEKELKTPAKEIKVYTPYTGETGVAQTVARIFQGVINKTQPRVYIADNTSLRGVDVSSIRKHIIETYGDVELVPQVMDTIKAHRDFSVFWSLWRDYSNEIENIYIFDLSDGLQDSMNVAAMLAGRNKGIAVTKDLYLDLYSEGCIGNRNVIDVCETYGFTFAQGTLGINKWIGENMVEGSNKELIFMLYPGDRDTGSSSHPVIYDLAVAVDGLIYWIDPDFDTFLNVQKSILDQFGSNALVIGWPGINMERAYVNSITECGKNVVCADWGFENGSVVSGFENYYPTECTTVVPKTETVLNNKVYVAFTVSDGDAWHYATRELLAYWNSPVRGTVPITWTIPSLFAKYHPTLLEYLYDTKTPMDEFIQGPSGVGYIYPSKMSDDVYDDYLEKTKSAFEKTKINMVNYWDTSTTYYTADNARLKEYAETVKPDAIFLGHELNNNDYFMIGDTVCINEMGVNRGRGTHTAEEIVENIDRAVSITPAGKPVFVAVNVEAWGQGVNTIAEAYSMLLDREDAGRYEFVTSASLVGKIRSYEKNGANGTFSSTTTINKMEVSYRSETENAVLIDDHGSGHNSEKGNRYADGEAYWIYKFTFEKPMSFLMFNAVVGEEFLINISTDGVNWKKAIVYGGSREGDKSYIFDAIKLLGVEEVSTIYVRFEDAVKTNGFGCSLTSLKLYYY